MSGPGCPFDARHDPDRAALWHVLVERDIEAFVAGDWDAVAGDFDADGFSAVDASTGPDPDDWGLGFATLEDYRTSWLEQSAHFVADHDDPAGVLHDATTLVRIEVRGDRALAHKQFDGTAWTRTGRRTRLAWRTLYQCRRDAGRWLVTGFVGYLPLHTSPPSVPERLVVEPASRQHATAGPYSPVLRVESGALVVISGQAALDADGTVTSDDFAGQSVQTLASCAEQLAAAGATLADVVKVNVYLADIADWAEFNVVYAATMTGRPLPVRTAVGAALLPGLRVELEMWAVVPGRR